MGLFSILNTVRQALPSIWDNVGNPLVTSIIHGIGTMDMSMAPNGIGGEYLTIRDVVRSGGGGHSLDDPISEQERKQEEVLVVTHQEITQRQLIAFAQEQMKVDDLAFGMPVNGLAKSSVVLSLHLEYTYSSEHTNMEIKNVNYNDHVYFHIMPKRFAFYDNLMRHDLFKFRNLSIKSASTSGFDTATMIGFFPVTTDTSQCSNGLLMQICKKLEVKADEDVSYNVRYVSPDVVSYTRDSNKDYKDIKSKYMCLEPNKVIKTDYIKGLEENTDLSYGTIVIVKQNVGAVVGMSFTINMEFDCWDYVVNGVKLSEIKDKNLNGVPDDQEGGSDGGSNGDNDGGSAPGTGSSRFPGKAGRRVR